jgi:hypothetical protein
MFLYKIKKSGNDRVIHIILEDNFLAQYPTPRPPTEQEIEQIENRERTKKVNGILKEYRKRKEEPRPAPLPPCSPFSPNKPFTPHK